MRAAVQTVWLKSAHCSEQKINGRIERFKPVWTMESISYMGKFLSIEDKWVLTKE